MSPLLRRSANHLTPPQGLLRQQRADPVKVLLRRDVKGVGKRGDIVEVSSG
ncbi:MAG: hypothetical protein EBT17_02965, partial [Actinobacteria bacterium]|nr:hypothetical protein [Actinomycetota bacterium]